jgi:hypothetical protein
MRPVYRTMKLPLRISLVAKRPRPVLARPTRNGRREVDVVFELEGVFERRVLDMSLAMLPLL